jgi:hypothetical protein
VTYRKKPSTSDPEIVEPDVFLKPEKVNECSWINFLTCIYKTKLYGKMSGSLIKKIKIENLVKNCLTRLILQNLSIPKRK